MTAPNRLNLWMAASTGERDLIVTANGLLAGDFCLVDATNLYVCVDPDVSVWRPIAGVPTFGRYSFSGNNPTAVATGGVLQYQAFTFSAVLDVAPTSVTLLPPIDVANWSTPPVVVEFDRFGFTARGTSDPLTPAASAWRVGLYMIND